VAKKAAAKRRSGCPVSISLDLLGDRWSLLIVRDMMVRGYRSFREFQRAGEGIATNILSERLQKLEAGGIIERETAEEDGRRTYYRLTAKGMALAPVLLELLIWGGRNEKTDAPCAAIEQMEQNRAAVIAETYRRWEQRDTTPLIPPFTAQGKTTKTKNKTRNRKNKTTIPKTKTARARW
jgi:DNA-binding HxlR family transcriptional regulator